MGPPAPPLRYLFSDRLTSLWIYSALTTEYFPEYLYYHGDVDQVFLLI